MPITLFSLLMSFLWFSLFAAAFSLGIRYSYFIQRISLWFPTLLALFCLVRAALPLDIPVAWVIPSYRVLPAVRRFFERPLTEGMTMGSAALLLYGLVSLALVLRLLARLLRFRRWVRALPPCRDSRVTDRLRSRLGPKVPFRVYQTAEIAVPYTTGLGSPAFLLPAYDLSDRQLDWVLAHEATHYTRKHLWAKQLLNLFTCFLWWNPMMYVLKANYDHFLEVKCDQLVLAPCTEEEADDYLATIMALARLAGKGRRPSPAACLGMVSARGDRQLSQRIQAGMQGRPKKQLRQSLLSLLCLLIVFFSSYAFILQSVGAPQNEAGIFEITPETAYLIDNGDSTYSLYVDNSLQYVIEDAAMLESEPFTDLTILQGGTP